MVNESNFIVRLSGRRESTYYIDYMGVYKVNEIAKIVGIKPTAVKDKYLENKAFYDDSQDIYYFGSEEDAKKTISNIISSIKADMKGRVIHLTEAEIEYIRKALINEGSNVMHVSNKIKDAIFKKLNE
ncbi:MAG: hypothetical protein Q8920_06805 [Bacillota bacterium]|nr:hypothetical protein [Bacillota bacterium]